MAALLNVVLLLEAPLTKYLSWTGEALLLQAVLHAVHHVSAPNAMQLHHDINNLATCKTNSPCIYLGQMQIQS